MAFLMLKHRKKKSRDSHVRGFASCLRAGWSTWVRRFNEWLRLLWLEALAAGVVGVLWCAIRGSMSWHRLEIEVISLDIVFGGLALFVLSMARQTQMLNADNAPMRLWQRELYVAKRAFKPFLPLAVAWACTYLIIYMVMQMGFNVWLSPTCMVGAVLLLMPLAGAMQSYLEASNGKMLCKMGKFMRMSLKWWGGMASMFVISIMTLALLAMMLLLGEEIIFKTISSSNDAALMGEEIEVPQFVGILKYFLILFVMAVLTMAQGLWSLPQQEYALAHFDAINNSKDADALKQ